MVNRPDDSLGKAGEGCAKAFFLILERMRQSSNPKVKMAGNIITAIIVIAFLTFFLYLLSFVFSS